MHDIPIVDKSTLLLMANNELMLDLLRWEFERAKSLVGWMLWAAKTYGIKASIRWWPGSGERTPTSFTRPSKDTRASRRRRSSPSSRRSSTNRIAASDASHQNNPGVPGNVTSTIETMNILQGHARTSRKRFMPWRTLASMRSEAPAIAAEFLKNKNLTCDVGCAFRRRQTITADGPWQHLLYELTGRKWGNRSGERNGLGIVPYVYSDHHLVNAVQWAVGLELLLIDDPWRVPDHRPSQWRRLLAIPGDPAALMDVEFRKEKCALRPKHKAYYARGHRPCYILRGGHSDLGGPARALGLTQKGHLGVGADGDVTIIPRSRTRRVSFSYPLAYVLKGERWLSRRAKCERSAKGVNSSCTRISILRSRKLSVRSSRTCTRSHSKTTRRK